MSEGKPVKARCVKKTFMGIDQHGNTYHGLHNPRTDLVRKLGYKHVSKMYVDTKSGETKHVGYVVGPYWVSIYEVCAWKKA